MPLLYFSKMTNWEKHILTEEWFENCSKLEHTELPSVACYSIKDFTVSEFEKIMTMPFERALQLYFPNI